MPSDEEWDILMDYLGVEVAGGKLKDKWSGLWYPPNEGATNQAKFYGLPGGKRNEGGGFTGYRYYGYWWASTSFDEWGAWYRRLSYNDPWLSYAIEDKKHGFSVRCVADP